MNIKRDLSDLPVADAPGEAEPVKHWPLDEPSVGPRLAEAWFNKRQHDDNLPQAVPGAGLYRGSYAGSCSRQIWYKMREDEPSNPVTIADHWRMDLGSMVHEQLQDAITAAMPNALHEVKVDLNAIGIPGSMHIDTVNIIGDDECETVEIKTINGFGYKSAATSFKKSGPEGPRESAIIQAALGACAYDEVPGTKAVSGARIVYLSMELVSPALAAKIGYGGEVSRFCAEWFIPMDQCIEIVARERKRINMMMAQNENNSWVNPVIPTDPIGTPGKIMVLNPKTGAAVTTGGEGTKTWQCNYCQFQDTCMDDHATQQKEES